MSAEWFEPEEPWDFADEAYLDQADRIAELRELEGADQ